MKVSELPEAVRQLQVAAAESSFVVFIFDQSGRKSNADVAVNLQYSIENGRVGLDWVLLSAANVADKDDIVEFAAERHHQFSEREQNGVHYLRVEDEGIASLGLQIVTEFYRRSIDSDLDVVADGFRLNLAS